MKFSTTFAIAATVAATFASAAPTPGANTQQIAARGYHGKGHGHKYGGNRKQNHSHKQPIAAAPEVEDEWDEDEPCVSGAPGPAAAAIQASSSSSAAASASSSASPVPSSSAQETPSSSAQPEPTSTQEAPKPEPTSSWEEPKQEPSSTWEEPPKETPKENNNNNNNGGGKGSQHGQITTYSVTNPAENHGLEAGTVACYTLNRKFSNDDYIAAVKTSEFNIGLCGRRVNACGPAGCVEVQIVDSCAGGGCKTFDLSPAAFKACTGDTTGIYDITYDWLD